MKFAAAVLVIWAYVFVGLGVGSRYIESHAGPPPLTLFGFVVWWPLIAGYQLADSVERRIPSTTPDR